MSTHREAEHAANRAAAPEAAHPEQTPVRKTMGFSRSTQMHDLVIGLLVNRYEVGLPV